MRYDKMIQYAENFLHLIYENSLNFKQRTYLYMYVR